MLLAALLLLGSRARPKAATRLGLKRQLTQKLPPTARLNRSAKPIVGHGAQRSTPRAAVSKPNRRE
jgi:hypothetical protein